MTNFLPRWLLNLILVVILLVGFVLAWFGWQWWRNLNTPLLSNQYVPLVVELKPGTPLIAIAVELKKAQLLHNSDYFIAYARMHHMVNHIKAGEYLIMPGKTTAAKLLQNMAAGRIFLRQVTFVNGWTFQQILATMNNNPFLQHNLAGLTNDQIMAKLGISNLSPEGRFYPDTYLFAKGTPDSRILTIAYQKMAKVIHTEWQQRAGNLPYSSPDQALVTASLIERETSLDSEKPMIASVILNRLQKNMRLQIDPTVIYALGNSYQGVLTRPDMKVDSPYNTYLYKGLPPTPIAIPSVSSLRAALHPAASDALYYVANRQGGHVFSVSLAEHNQAIQRYLMGPKVCPLPANKIGNE